MSTSFADRRLALTIMLALASCTPALGLDSIAVDFDRDGVADDRDVCPQDYDPAQIDSDRDGTGDACSACMGLTLDLDADGRDDSCDACIGRGAIGQDLDDDGIDDGCDACVDGVGTTGSDIDQDGADDGCDPCVAGGADRDLDGIDDACDSCLFGPADDEDGDGVADACDVCPADSDPGQVRGSDDDVGSACDPDVARDDSRVLFDGFASARRGIWFPIADWTTAGGEVTVDAGSPAQRKSFYDVSEAFVARTFVRFDGANENTSRLGLQVYATLGIRLVSLECTVTAAGILESGTIKATEALDVSQGVELRAVRTIEPVSRTVDASCTATDGNGKTVSVPEMGISDEVLNVSLYAEVASGAFLWLDVIEHRNAL